MSIVAIGCSHRSAPLSTLERLTVAADDLPKALHELAAADHLSEAVVLSTCNRIEVYAYAERFHGGYQDVREFLARHAGLPPEEVADHLYAFHDIDAARHLFRVAAGLDSAVVGEHEILGQVRAAWQAARDEDAVGAVLDPLFRQAVETGKRARTETGIARGIASVSHAAVALAAHELGTLEGRRVAVVGAGEMAVGTVKSLAQAGAADIAVVNRTWDRAVELASTCGGHAEPLDRLADVLVDVDLLVTTTGAQDLILGHAHVDEVLAARDRRLVIVDVAVPRDVDPRAGELPGVTLFDMDGIGAFVDAERAGRRREVAEVERIVDDEVARYQALRSVREVAPLITALRVRVDEIRRAELERYGSRLAGLDERQREAVEALTRGIVNTVLHEPTVRLKDAAGQARGARLADALRDLFDL